MTMSLEQVTALIRDVPDFPKPGIVFKDIAPLLAHPEGLRSVSALLAADLESYNIESIVGIESRGFLFGAGLAMTMGVGLELARKAGKLPFETISQSYELEYGTDTIEMHTDAVVAGRRYAVVDDLVATGGTAAATCQLIEKQGGIVAVCGFIIELSFLPWREKLGDRPTEILMAV